jgi:ornithine cyclodeaminase/alanine dehydrogenase-like protein (mu-crystallin family)
MPTAAAADAPASPLLLREDDVAGLLTMPEAIEAVEAAFAAQARGEGANHPRARFFVPGGVLHHMAAALPGGGVMGTKTYTSFAGGGTRFWVMLYSAENGDLLALIEADRLGQIRTGAATGVAVRRLAPADARVAAVLGTGGQARTQVEALAAVRPGLREIRAFGRDAERRLRFCREMTDALGVPVTPAHGVEAAVKGAQIVVCVTSAREPILRGEHLAPGVFVAAAGANRLTAREIDEEVVGRADVVVVDDVAQARVEAAELIFAHERRRFAWERARSLADLVAGRIPGRERADQITLFKSLGVALEDVAVAALVHAKARAAGIGKEL